MNPQPDSNFQAELVARAVMFDAWEPIGHESRDAQ
jgi:hypothetical protein